MKQFFKNEQHQKQLNSLYRRSNMKKYDDKVKRQKEKFDRDVLHYEVLLDDMIKHCMSQINAMSTLEQINELASIGDSGWKIICARVRKTNSVLKLNIDAFQQNLRMELLKVYEPNLPSNEPTNA
jgi:hypothetical protein